MMLREAGDGWHYDHWFVTPRRRRPRLAGGRARLALVCIALIVGSVASVMIPG